MVHTITAVRSAVIVAVAGPLLAGCSSGATTEPTDATGPLDTYLSAVYERQDDRDATELNAMVEEVTAACMAAEGFEYAPAPPLTDDEAAPDVEWSPDDADWVAKYGYGLTRNPYSDQPSAASAAPDPNAAYLETLSESEQQAYNTTLWGDYEVDPDDGGCYGEAYEEVSGPDPTQQDEFQPLMDAISAFYQSAEDAPEFAALDADWSDCMATKGHDFAQQVDAQSSIADAVDAVLADDPDAGPDSPAMTTLHENEVALAGDDLACRESTDYTARWQQIDRDRQQQFVDDHRSELDALLASVASS